VLYSSDMRTTVQYTATFVSADTVIVPQTLSESAEGRVCLRQASCNFFIKGSSTLYAAAKLAEGVCNRKRAVMILDEQILNQCHCPPHINDGTLTNLHNELI